MVTRFKQFLLGLRFTLQTSQRSLCIRSGYSWKTISEKHELSKSADAIRLWFERYSRRARTPRWCVEQTRIWWVRWQWSSLLCTRRYLFCSIRPGVPARLQNLTGVESNVPRCHQKKNKTQWLETVLRSKKNVLSNRKASKLSITEPSFKELNLLFHTKWETWWWSNLLRPTRQKVTETAVRYKVLWPEISQ